MPLVEAEEKCEVRVRANKTSPVVRWRSGEKYRKKVAMPRQRDKSQKGREKTQTPFAHRQMRRSQSVVQERRGKGIKDLRIR